MIQLPKARWLEIDAKRAEEMLKKLLVNRKLVPHHVSFLAREMREGRWKINGDTIRFSSKRLLDGQHRLHAVMQSQVTIWALVVEELEDTVFDTIDTGRNRGAGDIVSALGKYQQPHMVVAVARFIWYYEHNLNLDTSIKISNHELIQIIQRNIIISELANYITSKNKAMRASSIVASLVLISRTAGEEMTMAFADKLVTGVELKSDSPIRFFREKWLMRGNHRSSRGERAIWIAVLIKTYNAWISNKKVSQIERWRIDEKFPEVAKTPEQGKAA